MKKFWLKVAIWVLTKLSTKIDVDFNKNEKNDLTEVCEMLQKKLDNLDK